MNVSPRRIDTHAHIVPDFYRDWLATKGIDAGGLPVPFWSVEAALDIMGKTGVETAILSVSTPGVEPGDVNETRAMARRLNVYSAAIVAAHPGRFGFFATLTLPDVEGALAEAAYAFDSLKADGVVLHAHAKGIYLGDPAFDPLMEELNRRKAVIFVHPSELPGGAVPGIPAYVADFLLDSVRAAVNLTTKGVMNRCPDIKVILSHAGGFLPYAATRIAGAISPGKLPVEAMQTLRRFYLDTALSSADATMPTLLAFADPTHITYGSDFPYAPALAGAFFTSRLDVCAAADHHAINRGNAKLLFPRLAALRT
ncbi:MAG: amidohydrolase family protein [Xanthobacteraceae bacterium]